jgi:hypothetical protein
MLERPALIRMASLSLLLTGTTWCRDRRQAVRMKRTGKPTKEHFQRALSDHRPEENQRLLRYGPNVLRGNPKASFKWASPRTSHNLLTVSRSDSDRSESTRSTARKANVVSASLLRSKADRIEAERMTSRNRKTVAASVRLFLGGRFWQSRTCATLRASMITRSELMRKQGSGGYSDG